MSMIFVLYDFMQVPGGAERVTLAFAKALPGSVVLVGRKESACEALLTMAGIRVQTLASAWTRRLGRVLEAIVCFKWQARCIAQATTVVYSGFYAPLAVDFQRSGQRIYYCHTIPRFAYDLRADSRAGFAWYLRPLFDVFTTWLRWQYSRAVRRMDTVWVNSENVRQRLEYHLGVQAQVLYPPVDTQRFVWRSAGDYYISLARLEPLKRVDVIVRAFMQMPDRKLVVASGGSQLTDLKRLAMGAGNIMFTDWTDEDELNHWVGHARAAIYIPLDEDFGMSPVEAMAAGKPVIGVAEGGLLETVVHGQTGWLIEGAPTPEKVMAAVDSLEAMNPPSLRGACELRAGHFDTQVFVRKIRQSGL